MDKIGAIMAVTLVTWIGLFLYMVNIDRSLRRMERDEREKDDL